MPSQPPSTPPAPLVLPFVHPLDDFYVQAGLPLPSIEVVDGKDMPEPYRSLLVHNNDMTPTLEQFHGATVHLQVLGSQQRDGTYFREVLLRLDTDDRVVEFGAIKINLSLFAPAARRMILEERLPLGHILAEGAIRHFSRPKAFLRLEADEFIGASLGVDKPTTLYGRRNTLSDLQNRSLAEIVEILPPAAKPSDRAAT